MSADTPTWKETISLDETNKIRLSLGLKPLSDSGPSKTSDALAEENFQKRKDQEAKEKEAASLKARIDKARNTLDRGRKLVGVGLGADEMEGIKLEEGEPGEADAKAWVKKQKKRAKELAAKRAKEIEEMDKRFEEEGLPKYGEDDLKGIKVLHEEEEFEEGKETILTLKDSRVLDDEDDELHNLNISENAKTAEALALKKKGRLAGTYTGYDDDEFEGGVGAKRSVLSKYDEEIEGREDGGFRLGGPAVPSKKAGKGKEKEEDREEKERVKLTMDYTKSFTTDYLQEDEVGFKQKKKKKRAPRVMTHALAEDSMDVDSASTFAPSIPPRRTNLDETNLIDDDDLQASLARTRREVNKKKIAAMKSFAATAPPPPTNGMDVDAIKEESDDERGTDNAPTGGDDDVIVMDDTSEFVRNITLAAAARTAAAAAALIKVEANGTGTLAGKASNGAASVMPVIKAEPEDVPLSEVAVGGWGPAREDGEESDEDVAMEEGEDAPGREEEEAKPVLDEDGFGGTATEGLVSRGMASTLNFLRHQGLIHERTAEELLRDKQQKEKEKWLAEQRRRDRERDEERRRAKEAGSSKDQQTREYENRMREREEAQATHEAFANYKPVVNLTYHDEFGRDQTPKEAWKQLSHNFHGHGSGTKKTEKRLKKIEDERKREMMGSGDTPLSTATAFAARAERLGSATMVLSVGNKGAAPIQEEMLSNFNKDAALKKAKGKGKSTVSKPSRAGSSAPSNASFDILRPLPLPVSEARSGSPAVRAGFAPVGQFAARAAEGRSDSPAQAEKLIIPVSVKRKPVAEADGGPSRKK